MEASLEASPAHGLAVDSWRQKSQPRRLAVGTVEDRRGQNKRSNSMPENNVRYFIEKIDGQQFPMYRTTEGGIAVFIFSTHQDAEWFIDHKGKSSEWKILELSTVDAHRWLLNAQKQGVTDVFNAPTQEAIEANVMKPLPLRSLLLIFDLAQE
jgi:hypothetical protein